LEEIQVTKVTSTLAPGDAARFLDLPVEAVVQGNIRTSLSLATFAPRPDGADRP